MGRADRVRGRAQPPVQVDAALRPIMKKAAGDQFYDKAVTRNWTSTLGLLSSAIPFVEVSTDIIVGFPSETDEDFERTLDLVKALRPSWAYTFKYSPREGTESAGMTDDVPAAVKEERLQRLNAVCDALTEAALAAKVGSVVEVLDEEVGFGRTRDGFRVSWPESGPAGKTVMVRITGTSKRVLKGERDERV